MKINYTVERDDMTAAMEYSRLRNVAGFRPSPWPIRLSGLLLFYVFLGDDLHFALSGYGFRPELIAAILALAALWVLAPRLLLWLGGFNIRRTVNYDLRLPMASTMEIRDDGFAELSDGLEFELKWSLVKELAVIGGGRLYILTRGLEFFVVPPSAFRDAAARDAFLDRLAELSGRPVEGRAGPAAEPARG